MKHIILSILLSLSVSSLFAQNELKYTCYVYRTYEDLLSRNNKLERDYYIYNSLDMDVFSYKVEGSKKGKKFKLKDSSYVGYELYINKVLASRCIFHQKLGRFTQLLGGNKNGFMIGSGRSATVSYSQDDAYVVSVWGDQFFSWYFAKMDGDKQVYFNTVLDIIKDDPELLKLYDLEYVKENNVRKARENDFRSDVKYLKLYLEKHK